VATIASGAALFGVGMGLAAPTYGAFDEETEFVRARCHYRTLTIAGGVAAAASVVFGVMLARAPGMKKIGLLSWTLAFGVVAIILTSVGAARLANLEEPGSSTSPLIDLSF
jgi:hypothetical protein